MSSKNHNDRPPKSGEELLADSGGLPDPQNPLPPEAGALSPGADQANNAAARGQPGAGRFARLRQLFKPRQEGGLPADLPAGKDAGNAWQAGSGQFSHASLATAEQPHQASLPTPGERAVLASVSSQVTDDAGWAALSGRRQDYDPAQVQENYADALTAWRKNPIAFRIIAITTDYVVGDHILLASPQRSLDRFIQAFWHHPKNRMDLRLEGMCEELSRAGDLFVALFRNESDGLSYLRFVTKDRILRIETAENDWENELAYYEQVEGGGERRWLSPAHPASAQSGAVMLHYAVNRPIGALLGESDLATMIPWLQRYSRMLEDRVRLHWAMRLFLWVVTVPASKVREKQEQYRLPPESGSIIVKDESEQWEAQTPTLRGADASHDLEAVRGMIDAGSGYPPHWRGESGQANLATATAMQAPTERHLLRRQRFFSFMLQDIVFQAYQRAAQVGKARPIQPDSFSQLFSVRLPDISRGDNEALARAAGELAAAFQALQQVRTGSKTLDGLARELVLQFAGEPRTEEVLRRIEEEME